MLGRIKRTWLSGLSTSLLTGETAEFLHLSLGPGQHLTKALKPVEIIYYYSVASNFMCLGIEAAQLLGADKLMMVIGNI